MYFEMFSTIFYSNISIPKILGQFMQVLVTQDVQHQNNGFYQNTLGTIFKEIFFQFEFK